MHQFSVDLARAEHRERIRRRQLPAGPDRRFRRGTARQLRRLAHAIEPTA